MAKNAKLNLKDLLVNSFTTTVKNDDKIKGGSGRCTARVDCRSGDQDCHVN